MGLGHRSWPGWRRGCGGRLGPYPESSRFRWLGPRGGGCAESCHPSRAHRDDSKGARSNSIACYHRRTSSNPGTSSYRRTNSNPGTSSYCRSNSSAHAFAHTRSREH